MVLNAPKQLFVCKYYGHAHPRWWLTETINLLVPRTFVCPYPMTHATDLSCGTVELCAKNFKHSDIASTPVHNKLIK